MHFTKHTHKKLLRKTLRTLRNPSPVGTTQPGGGLRSRCGCCGLHHADSRDARKRTLDRGPDGQPESHAPVNGLCEKVVDSHHLLDFSTMLSVNKSVGGYESQVNRLPR